MAARHLILLAALTVLAPPGAALAVEAPPAPRPDPAVVAAEPPAPSAAPRMKVITLDPGAVMRQMPPTSPLSTADIPTGGVIRIAVNKSRPIDLPAEASEIIVGSPEIADVLVRAPKQVYLMAKAVGDTNIFVLGRDGRLLLRLEVNVHADVETLRTMLSELLPDEVIDVTAFSDTVTLAGTVRSDAVAQNARAIARRFVAADANLINMLKVAGEQQVLLRVRMAEMRRSVLKDLSVKFSKNAERIGNFTIGAFSVPDETTGLSSLTNPLGLGGAAIANPLASVALGFTHGMSLNLEALENEGLVKTLAEPTVTAVSGEQAQVFSGTDVPIVYEDENRISVSYRSVGISLSFVPVIVGPGRISLKISTEASGLGDRTVAGYPEILARRASTSVEMPSGGSMMIAGILSNDISNAMAGVPGLMDVPVLGALFRSTTFNRGESELVVMIEAYVVEPTSPKKIALPSDGFVPASDLDRYLLGRLHKVYGKPDLPAGREPVQGPIGYIVQ